MTAMTASVIVNREVIAIAAPGGRWGVREVVREAPENVPFVYPHVRQMSGKWLSLHETLEEARLVGSHDPDYFYIP